MDISEIDLWVSIEQTLTPDEFRMVQMYYRWKMTQQQIADEEGVTQQAVSGRLEKIIKKLKEQL